MKTVTANPRTDKQNRHLHWLFAQLGIKDKDAIAEIVWEHTNHRTHHTSELWFIEAMTLINSLNDLRIRKQPTTSQRIDMMADGAPERAELDRKRKGLIKAIFRWFELRGMKPTMDYVKGVACKAACVDNFNDISNTALTRLYAEFCRKQKAVAEIEKNNFTFCLN